MRKKIGVLCIIGFLLVGIQGFSACNKIMHVVYFDSQGGSEVADYSETTESNRIKIPEPNEPTKLGYYFYGWYKETECVNEWDFENDWLYGGEMTLYARWENTPPVTKNFFYAVYDVAEIEGIEDLQTKIERTRLRLADMLLSKGYPESAVAIIGGTKIRVEVYDANNPAEIFQLLGKPATIEFRNEKGEMVITGEHLDSAHAAYDADSAGYAVYLKFNSEGTKRFSDATAAEFLGQKIYIYLTAGDEVSVISAPVINSQITNGRAVITGLTDLQAAQALADQITSGKFEVKLTLIESGTGIKKI